jgi:hypothetical protein
MAEETKEKEPSMFSKLLKRSSLTKKIKKKKHKRGDKLINIARKNTENEEYSNTSGISDDEMYQWLNDAQYRLLSRITTTHPKAFIKESADISVANGQELYSLPDDIYLENRIVTVEYSHTGLERDYIKLDKGTLSQREPNSTGYPNIYIRRTGKILLHPIPSSNTGMIRINYQRRIAEIMPRLGQVSAITLDSATKTITSLTINPDQTDYDSTSIIASDHLCLIDILGNQNMTRVQIDTMDISTGVVTVNSSFVYEAGESISVGDYVVEGYNSTTHSELSKSTERFLIAYLVWKILKRDSSEDHMEQRNELKSMENDIVEGYAEIDDDINYLPIIDEDY